jgi:hypothetical protein
MSAERTFDPSVTWAADCYIDAYGLDGAIERLQARREAGYDNGRVNEALAYLRRREAER